VRFNEKIVDALLNDTAFRPTPVEREELAIVASHLS